MNDNYYQVDVIIPVYNVEAYLDECIVSIIQQSYTNIQLILVDDGSKDSSGIICDSWSKRDNRIVVIHKENGGLVSAWKAGLLKSDSEWVVFADSDDWLEFDHIKLLVKEQVRTNADVVVTRMRQVGAGLNEYIPFAVEAKCYEGESLEKELYPVMINAGGFEKRGVPFSRCSKLIRKDLMIKNLKYEYDKATYEEDFNIMAPVLMDSKIISLIKVENAAYCYRRVEDSMLHGYSSKMADSIKNVYSRIMLAVDEKSKHYFDEQIFTELLSAYVRLYLNEIKSDHDKRKINNLVNEEYLDKCLEDRNKWNYYPLKYRVVIYALKNRNNVIEHIVRIVLRFAYKYVKRKR